MISHTHLTESLPAFLMAQGNGDANESHLMFKASHCMLFWLFYIHVEEEGVCRNVMKREILPNIATARDPQKSFLQTTIFYPYIP